MLIRATADEETDPYEAIAAARDLCIEWNTTDRAGVSVYAGLRFVSFESFQSPGSLCILSLPDRTVQVDANTDPAELVGV